jgi:iron complex outermembrane receptor protein
LTKTNIPTPDLFHPGSSIFTAAARSTGVEVDIQGEILPGWDVIASYTNQDVRMTSGTGGLLGLQKEGQRVAAAPQNLASLLTTYTFHDESLKGLKIGGGYTYPG